MTSPQRGNSRLVTLVILLLVGAVLAVAVALLPKGFSDDLTRIGQGAAVAVLTHDKNTVGGIEAMDLLNRIRADFEPRMEFLVVDVNSPKGRAFTRQQKVGTTVLVLFTPDGKRVGTLDPGAGEQVLRSALLGFSPP
ncbi:hypothetical protein [Aestuariirhabdus litorea]|uniref:Uncharacterized protein n=1 Tax=Aestuariirhabdus litorea TaxID=2528527 RepID=A0A3P3VQM7_9GAMM|nr:hypothetical protein [Aestuariirhabdus litorea]RRJ83956.1 hypothetical protein D0544_02210 [Aestuariirhabdus litorea]RWW97176.1 hypothetical protein DZC74_02205 [Endozoicomonadaceae bacterium GTF-13]